MGRLLFSFVLVFGLAGLVAAVDLNPDETRLARFLAGIEILRLARLESAPEKLAKFTRLKKVTGLDNAHVIELIDKYKNDPEGWNRVVQRVRELLETQQPGL